MTTRDLLLEIGVEELPVSFLRTALESMRDESGKLFTDARLAPSGETGVVGTPRRLALLVRGVPENQPERRDSVVGPPWSAAFKDGKPTKAAEGFAKKNGVAVDALEKHTTDKGDYVAANVHEPGRAAKDVLPDLLAELCRRIRFPKSMRWGEGNVAFGRPVHWIVALFGNDVLPVEFAGVHAGRTTRGHRFLAPATFDVKTPSSYEGQLDAAHVVVDPDERKKRMHALLVAEAKKLEGVLVEDAFLLEECASLVEEPFVVPGSFEPRFLELPEAVVVSVMRHHQRYLAVRTTDGKLLPSYLNVVNTANDPAEIRKGNDRVLRARLRDAQFFVDEDRKKRLEDRVAGLDAVVYQAKLGSVGEKVARVTRLAVKVAETAANDGLKIDIDLVRRAATVAKADLQTLIVGEFPELQGDMGRFYALHDGLPTVVADAIRDHYKPKGADDPVPTEPIAAVVALADRADTLVGCFGIGLEPTGSADPFALRRAALGIIRILEASPALDASVDLGGLLARAFDQNEAKIPVDKATLLAKLREFFRARLRAQYRDHFPGDVVDACIAAWQGDFIRDLDARIRAVHAFRAKPELESLAIAFKRAFNIARDAPAGEPDPALLEKGAEQALAERFGSVRPTIERLANDRKYAEALTVIGKELREPIDRYFEQVFVMVEDERVRENRLKLLNQIASTVRRIAHFDQLSS